MKTYAELLLGHIELVEARRASKKFKEYKNSVAGKWTKSKERRAVNRYRMVANSNALQEEVKRGRILRQRGGEVWAEVLELVPEPYRSRVATLIWWDFPLPEIQKYMTTDLTITEAVSEEEIAIWLYECGYSAFKAIVRSKTQETL